jgi:hypothetical protein
MTKRFFHLDEDGCVFWWIVAVDIDHAKSILRKQGSLHGSNEQPIDKATGIVWSEMTSDAVTKMRSCHREDGGPPRPLAECEIGDAFCSEW